MSLFISPTGRCSGNRPAHVRCSVFFLTTDQTGRYSLRMSWILDTVCSSHTTYQARLALRHWSRQPLVVSFAQPPRHAGKRLHVSKAGYPARTPTSQPRTFPFILREAAAHLESGTSPPRRHRGAHQNDKPRGPLVGIKGAHVATYAPRTHHNASRRAQRAIRKVQTVTAARTPPNHVTNPGAHPFQARPL